MGVSEWVALFVSVLKVALILIEKMQKTPSEKRREALADFDKAIELAKKSKDLRDISKHIGGKL